MTERLDTEIYGDDDERPFDLAIRDTSQPLELAVQITSGELDVEVTDDVLMTVTISPDHDRGADPVARLGWDGQRLEVYPVKTSGLARVLRGSGAYDITIRVPRRQMTTGGGAGVTGRLGTASGEVRIDDLTGDLRVDSASGDISVARVAGRLECRAASGDIHLEAIHGQVRLAATSGDVNISESIVESLSLNSVSGDANVGIIPVGTGAIEVSTVSGSVMVDLHLAPESGRFALDVQSLSGSVDVEGPAERRGRRKWRLGDGPGDERPFRVRTVSGDVNVDVGAGTVPDGFRDLPVTPETAKEDQRRVTPAAPSDWQRIVGDIETGIGDMLTGLGRSIPIPPVPPTPPVPPLRPDGQPGPTRAPAPVAKADTRRDPEPAVVPGGGPDLVRPEPEHERLAILRELEEGQIDIEEAMVRLDRLGSAEAHTRPDPAD